MAITLYSRPAQHNLPDGALPLRLLRQTQGVFAVVAPCYDRVSRFDIISYTWGPLEDAPYDCGIEGVEWKVKISPRKIDDIKRFMINADIEYLWVDCVCIRQDNKHEKSMEISRMYQYYKAAHTCHILVDMPEVWTPQAIITNLNFLGHVLSCTSGAAVASEALNLNDNAKRRLKSWVDAEWTFPIPQQTAKSAAVDMGVLNCYSTCLDKVMSLFDNLYFTRVWTFQEMILGKNVTIWAIDRETISDIGQLDTWMDLAMDSADKAMKLLLWIDGSRLLKPAAVLAVMRVIEENIFSLGTLRVLVKGIECARTDIISGGPNWWRDNHKGISNIFAAIAVMPRECGERADLFRGLLGVFSGLFTADEVERDLSGDNIEQISYNFFKQLSIKTEYAWTKLAISNRERGEYDWIPEVESHSGIMTTECFAGVLRLGRMDAKDRAKVEAITGLKGNPRKFASIQLIQNKPDSGYQFSFKGCNCGKKVKTGFRRSERIETNNHPRSVNKDETGKMLIQCATILGSLIDPSGDVVEYRRELLRKLRPNWHVSDPNAKPAGWEDRCVSGTSWEHLQTDNVKVHNHSFNYIMSNLYGFDCRLATKNTAEIACEIRVNCGCTYLAPFPFVFQGLTAVYDSSLGERATLRDEDDRITVQDGLGLVQVGDVGKTFNLVAFGGDISAYKSFASLCRSTKINKPVESKKPWPSGRALVSEEFSHGLTSQMRDYGYVDTQFSGNLLICRSHPVGPYKIIGVCIDQWIPAEKKGTKSVKVR